MIRTVARFTLLAFALSTLLSCKVQLTPESISRTLTAIKSAREDLTPENEYYVGRSVATNLLSRADYEYADADAIRAGRLDGTTAYLNAIGNILAATALSTPRKGDRAAPMAGWHFVIVEDDTINAFAAPSGFVLVNRGTIKAARSEDELAAVLAHEVAHVVRGHALGSIKKSRWANVGKEFLDSSVQLDKQALGNLTQAFEGAMDDMIESMVVKGYSRDTEYEADRVGLQILAAAGYDPAAYLRLLEQMEKQQGSGKGGFSATHPTAKDRIAKLKPEVAKLATKKVPRIRIDRFGAALAL